MNNRRNHYNAAISTALLLCLHLATPAVMAKAGAKFICNDNASHALKVLFIGNSFTFANEMPAMFASMVKSSMPDKPLKVAVAAFPSYTLAQHLQDRRTLNLFEQNGPWDFVVLQERSFYPIREAKLMERNCLVWNGKIVAKGARTVILETWSDAATPADQRAINQNSRAIAKEMNAVLIPAGENWFTVPEWTRLYSKDNHHPNRAGSFLAACSVFASLLHIDPRTLSPAVFSKGIPPAMFQEITNSVATHESKTINRAGGRH